MQKLLDFYSNTQKSYTVSADKQYRRLKLLSASRLLTFAGTALVVYLLRSEVKWALLAAFFGVALFLFLVKYYEDKKMNYRFATVLARINATEIQVLQHQFHGLPDGSEYNSIEHTYAHDLDLFGQGSFFQYLNRTALGEGQDLLAEMLLSNNIDSIIAKQESIDELAQKVEWRQEHTARALLLKPKTKVTFVIDWLQNYVPFAPGIMRMVPWLFLAVTMTLGTMVFLKGWSLNLLVFWILLGLGISARYFTHITALANKADQVRSIFQQYFKLFMMIEEASFQAAQLRLQRQKLSMGDQKASESIKRFSELLNKMDYNNNIFYAIFGNGCFLGALQTAYHIEKWIGLHKEQVAEWFSVIAFFDAWNSLGNYSFNHPRYSYPILQNGPAVLDCKDLAHPLIPGSKNVKNDFKINDKDFNILTGSNMAGKSTFLRAVGLQIVMANMGLPVHATECLYNPIKLLTSMRSIDSLSRGESYFLSELKRLKFVVSALESERHFVLLDEILKGTNSNDKAVGSKKFLKRLVRANATGIIATHDLSLCETANELAQVQNYYLDATIKEDRLYYDYRLKRGISKTMNASFLLDKMDII